MALNRSRQAILMARQTLFALWADVTNDKKFDLLVQNFRGRRKLFETTDDGQFNDITDVLGAASQGATEDIAIADFNHDLLPDILLAQRRPQVSDLFQVDDFRLEIFFTDILAETGG